MEGWIVLTALAAFGALCAVWACFGWLLPGMEGAVTVCFCRTAPQAEAAVRRYRWLRGLGLLKGPMILVDAGAEPEELRHIQSEDIMMIAPPELAACLRQEWEGFDRAGSAAGRDQRRDLSKP